MGNKRDRIMREDKDKKESRGGIGRRESRGRKIFNDVPAQQCFLKKMF